LPDEKSDPIEDLGKAVILITGEKKIGKTSLSAQFGKNLNLSFEVGYKGLEIFQIDIPDWETARAVGRKLRKDKKFNTVTVDTADQAYKKMEKYVLKKHGIDHASELEWGKGWAALKQEFEDFIDLLTHTGKGVMLISHSQEKEVRTRDGGSYDRIMATIPKAGREIIEGLVDIWCHFGYDGKRRVLTILGDDHISAGHRFTNRFRTPDGRPVRRIDMGRNEKEGYANFLACWNNKYEPEDEDDIDAPPKKSKKSKGKFSLKK
jgi:AAA domain